MATLTSLQETYQDFNTPILYIKVKDKKLQNEKVYFRRVEAIMSTGFEASVCRIELEDISARYEKKALSLDASLASALVVGVKLELYLGYGKDTDAKLAFVGSITSLAFSLEAGNCAVYDIEAMDVKAFMMNNLRSELKKDVKKYSEAVSTILGKYSSFFTSKVVDDTSEVEGFIEQFRQSDYDFVVNLAKRVGYLFFVDRGKVKFIKYDSAKEDCLTITPSLGLLYFHREVSLSQQVKSVVVRVHDTSNVQKPIEATAKTPATTVGNGSKTAADVSKAISDEMEITIIDNAIRSAAEAKTRAEAELTRQSMSLVSGQVELRGIPDVFPGGMLEVKELTEDMNGKYLITEVKHIVEGNDFSTICRFGANKV